MEAPITAPAEYFPPSRSTAEAATTSSWLRILFQHYWQAFPSTLRANDPWTSFVPYRSERKSMMSRGPTADSFPGIKSFAVCGGRERRRALALFSNVPSGLLLPAPFL